MDTGPISEDGEALVSSIVVILTPQRRVPRPEDCRQYMRPFFGGIPIDMLDLFRSNTSLIEFQYLILTRDCKTKLVRVPSETIGR